MSETPQDPTPENTPSPLGAFLSKNKEKIYIGLILYLFGVNQTSTSFTKKETKRADDAEAKWDKHRDEEIMAANRMALRQMVNSDTVYIFGPDSIYRLPGFMDTTKK